MQERQYKRRSKYKKELEERSQERKNSMFSFSAAPFRNLHIFYLVISFTNIMTFSVASVRWIIILMVITTAKCNVFVGGWCGNDVNSCNPPSNGGYSRCEMCMCENLHKFVPGSSGCSDNNILYSCYISYRSVDDPPVVGCRVELKTAWLIGFIGTTSCVCSLLCFALGFYFCANYKKYHSKINYHIEDNHHDIDEEDLELATDVHNIPIQ